MKMATESSDFKGVKKLLKPLVEKRRRDRMNRSLDQLRSFLLKHTRSESFRNGKMEKAEILEMTVQFLRNTSVPDAQERRSAVIPHNYQAGFQECLQQVDGFVRSCSSINAQAKSGLMERLTDYMDRPAPQPQGHCNRDPRPGHSGTPRPIAAVPALSSHAPARHSPGLPGPLPSTASARLDRQHCELSPRKTTGWLSPACPQQHASKETVSHTVWRPWP